MAVWIRAMEADLLKEEAGELHPAPAVPRLPTYIDTRVTKAVDE